MTTHFDSGHDHTLACGKLKVVNRFTTSHEHVNCADCWSTIWAETLPGGCDSASVRRLQGEVRTRLDLRASWAALETRREAVR